MMGAIVFEWVGPVPGREQAAMQLMTDSYAFYDKAVADGLVTDYAYYASEQGLGDLWIVRGEMDQLNALTATPDFAALTLRSKFTLTDFTWAFRITGDSIEAAAAVWAQEIARLA